MPKVNIHMEGYEPVMQMFDQLAQEIGDKKANSKVLVPAVRQAMRPTLAMAKQLAPKNTGALAAHLQIEARRPTKRDRRSKYVLNNDSVIALVTTKAFPRKLKKKFFEENQNLSPEERAKKFKAYAKSIGFPYDARAVAQEFGSARNPAHPYMRTGLETTARQVIDDLAGIIESKINRYKAKNT